jgi:hypothetical protein
MSGEPTLFASNSKLTSKLVYEGLRSRVYPPCDKKPADIRMFHDIAGDLGYAGDSKQLLAGKTNSTFKFPNGHGFTGPEMMEIDTVEEHHEATCEKLKALGRL